MSYDLYGGTPPHTAGSATSKESAEKIEGSVATLRDRVLRYLKSKQSIGAIDEEIQLALGMRADTECPRRRELVLKGLVTDSGFTRRTRANRRAVVWVCTDFVDATDIKPVKTTLTLLKEANQRIEQLQRENRELRDMVRGYERIRSIKKQGESKE